MPEDEGKESRERVRRARTPGEGKVQIATLSRLARVGPLRQLLSRF